MPCRPPPNQKKDQMDHISSWQETDRKPPSFPAICISPERSRTSAAVLLASSSIEYTIIYHSHAAAFYPAVSRIPSG
jgi:hypothetical protein